MYFDNDTTLSHGSYVFLMDNEELNDLLSFQRRLLGATAANEIVGGEGHFPFNTAEIENVTSSAPHQAFD